MYLKQGDPTNQMLEVKWNSRLFQKLRTWDIRPRRPRLLSCRINPALRYQTATSSSINGHVMTRKIVPQDKGFEGKLSPQHVLILRRSIDWKTLTEPTGMEDWGQTLGLEASKQASKPRNE
jgi:hypothetical protein